MKAVLSIQEAIELEVVGARWETSVEKHACALAGLEEGQTRCAITWRDLRQDGSVTGAPPRRYFPR